MDERAEENPLWSILVETVHSLPMYPVHKAYVRDTLLYEEPNLTAESLSHLLNISLGEALVILHEVGEVEKEGLKRSQDT
jgi:hypothetical protein